MLTFTVYCRNCGKEISVHTESSRAGEFCTDICRRDFEAQWQERIAGVQKMSRRYKVVVTETTAKEYHVTAPDKKSAAKIVLEEPTVLPVNSWEVDTGSLPIVEEIILSNHGLISLS